MRAFHLSDFRPFIPQLGKEAYHQRDKSEYRDLLTISIFDHEKQIERVWGSTILEPLIIISCK